MNKKHLTFKFKGNKIDLEVEHRNRKSLEIQIKPSGMVRVLAPSRMTNKELLSLVETRGDWILSKLEHFDNMDLDRINKEFKNGEEFLYLGKIYKLQIEEDNRPRLNGTGKNVENHNKVNNQNSSIRKKPLIILDCGQDKIIIQSDNLDKEYIKEHLIKWYKERGLEVIKTRIEYYQPQISVKPTDVVVKEQKRRWGTCTSKRRLLFNWKIIMAPLSIIDYVVVHEMCHLIHMNHSKAYWDSLEMVLTNYKESKRWLKENGIWLDIQ